MKKIQFSLCALILFAASCQDEFLEKKPDKALLVPTTLDDFRALLDNVNTININPSLQIIAGDEYEVVGSSAGLNALQRNACFWADDVYEATSRVSDWDTPYKQVFYANIVLDGLQDIDPKKSPSLYNAIKGTALFLRACAWYNLAQLFAAPYVPNEDNVYGLPLPLTANVNERPLRSTVQETYRQLMDDLVLAATLLPDQTDFKSRPAKIAAYGLLARVYLTMQNYEQATYYANEALKINHTLMDFNELDLNASSPIPNKLPDVNNEVIYYSEGISYAFFRSALVRVNTEITNLFAADDLRKSLYFSPSTGRFRGYKGLAIDELYLIRAEGNCRLGRLTAAIADVNELLEHRYLKGTYDKLDELPQRELLHIVLNERKKELVMRGLRWSDLRRLNQDTETAVILTKNQDGTAIMLNPNENKYTFPLPQTEIGEGVPQNPR